MLTSYTYTKTGRIESIRHHNGIFTYYTYDKRGNRLFKTHYHYTLTPKAMGMAPVIDLEESYCYNESNQLIRREKEQESTQYSYDANGNLVKEVTTQWQSRRKR